MTPRNVLGAQYLIIRRPGRCIVHMVRSRIQHGSSTKGKGPFKFEMATGDGLDFSFFHR